MATKERRRAIKAYWAQKSDELRRRPRDFYKIFKPFLSENTKEETKIAIEINERIVANQKVVADELGDYFSTAANAIGGIEVTNLVENDFEKHPSLESIRQAYQGLQFRFNEIGIGEVENELKKIKSNKATGWDGISPKILKLTGKGIAPSLTSLYNTVIRKGNWPSTWKMGEWIPVFKKGDKTDRGNYRPITVLNSVDKVFETLLSKQITKTMNPHLYQKMTAYRKTHSCETTLIRLTVDWKMAADHKEYVTVLSTDMSKASAFDSLHPALMIQKLKAYGFNEPSLNLLRSFFERRKKQSQTARRAKCMERTKKGVSARLLPRAATLELVPK